MDSGFIQLSVERNGDDAVLRVGVYFYSVVITEYILVRPVGN